MRIGILGRKVGMTQYFDEKGLLVPITVIDTTGCVLAQVKTKDHDGYNAIQLGFGDAKPQNVAKPAAGHFKKASSPAKQLLKEFRMEDSDDVAPLQAGTVVSAGIFRKGDKVDVTGTSKGKGFAGVMKRFNFKGKDATHGTHEFFRHAGSAGTNTFPGRVIKNQGMPGHMGAERKTVQGLEVIDVRPEENLLFIRGAVPGARQGRVEVRLASKKMDLEGRGLTASEPSDK